MEPTQLSVQAIHALPGVLLSRYLNVAALTLLLWDHCLTFGQEKRLIWPSKASGVKWAFLCNQYIVPSILIINTYAQGVMRSPGLSTSFCKTWTLFVMSASIISISISQLLVLLKIWKLWDGKRSVILGSIIPFSVTQIGTIIIMSLMAHQAWPFMVFNKELSMCALTHRPELLKWLWTWLNIFELFIYLMACLNAWSRPRQSHTLLIKVLHRDGIYFFAATTTMRVLNLVISIISAPSQIFLDLCCIWALVTATISRMIINVREAELVMREASDEPESCLTFRPKGLASAVSQFNLSSAPYV